MKDLSDQRAAYLRDKVEESGGAEGSLDDGIFRSVREQAEVSGFKYDATAPAY
jgi:hypothetical protein